MQLPAGSTAVCVMPLCMRPIALTTCSRRNVPMLRRARNAPPLSRLGLVDFMRGTGILLFKLIICCFISRLFEEVLVRSVDGSLRSGGGCTSVGAPGDMGAKVALLSIAALASTLIEELIGCSLSTSIFSAHEMPQGPPSPPARSRVTVIKAGVTWSPSGRFVSGTRCVVTLGGKAAIIDLTLDTSSSGVTAIRERRGLGLLIGIR